MYNACGAKRTRSGRFAPERFLKQESARLDRMKDICSRAGSAGCETDCGQVLDRLLQGVGLRRDSQLAELLGVTPQAVSQARRKGRVPDGWVLRLASRFALSTDWIYFGRGEAKSLPGASSPSLPSLTHYKDAKVPGEAGHVEMAFVPLVSARLAAGMGSLENGGEVEGYFGFRQEWLCRKGDPDRMVLMKVFGDSMEPDIRHGDMVLVNQAQTSIFGHAIYAVGVNEEIYIKQIETLPGGRLVLRSLNRSYDPIEVDLQGDLADFVRIIGRVIWWCREA